PDNCSAAAVESLVVTAPLLVKLIVLPACEVVTARPKPETVTLLLTVAVTLPFPVKLWIRSVELAVAPSVLVVLVVEVLTAQMTEFAAGVALPVTSQAPAAAAGPASSIVSI